MALTPHLKSIEDLYEKLEREDRRAHYAEKEIDQADHFYNFCVTAHSMKDYFFERKGITKKRDKNKEPYYDQWAENKFLVAASEIANMSKHLMLREWSGEPKAVGTKAVEPTKSGFVNVYFDDDVKKGGRRNEFVTGPDLIIILEDGEEYELWNFTGQVIRYWKNFLIEEASAKDYFNKNSFEARLAKCRAAASSGDATAQTTLAFMYYFGQDVDQDFAEAKSWYYLAAVQGDADAQYTLGAMYEEGHGVPQDHDQAARWYKRAAGKGDVRAQVNLGFMYALGKGVPQNYTDAHRLMNVAAAGGHQDAAKVRDLLAKLMKPDEIREAQHRALNWWRRMHRDPSDDD